MNVTIVQYQTTPETAEENEKLVAAVYAELAASDPGNLRYATFRLDDGVSFVHVAMVGAENPLPNAAAFRAFQAGLKDRCVTPPTPSGATLVGSYGIAAA